MTVKEINYWGGERRMLERLGLTHKMPRCDYEGLSDVLKVGHVAQKCTEFMQATELKLAPSADCTSKSQPAVSARMRAILVSWLVEVHEKWKLHPETLFITVNLIDRYCDLKKVLRSEYQLLGITALLIACKYEEILVPKLEDFGEITDNTYTTAQILAQECNILKVLSFDITFPTTHRLLERYHALAEGTKECFFLACYSSELCLIDVKMNKWAPSRLASACLYLAKKLLD